MVIETILFSISAGVFLIAFTESQKLLALRVFKSKNTIATFRFCFLTSTILLSATSVPSDSCNDRAQGAFYTVENNKEIKPILLASKLNGYAQTNDFLNKNNLYKNYKYNYMIKFPNSYNVDYGISLNNIQAHKWDSGYAISVTAAFTDLKQFMQHEDLSNENISEMVVKGMAHKYKTQEGKNIAIKAFENRGMSDVVMIDSKLVNFNNRYFVKNTFTANVLVESISIPVVVTNFISHYNQHNYQVIFRTLSQYNTIKWKGVISSSMSSFFIKENIK